MVSARRTLLGASVLIAGALAGFAVAFADILWPGELFGISLASALSLIIGWNVGQLRFHSRDLKGSELSCVVWGRYANLNRQRREIVAAMRAMKPEDLS